MFRRAVFAVADCEGGISEAKLLTLVRIRFTAAVIRAESAGSLMRAAWRSAGKLWFVSWIRPSIFCKVSALGLVL